MRDGNEMSPILDVMKDSTTMPAELVDTWEDSWKNSQLSKVTFSFFFFYITPTTSFFSSSDSLQGRDEMHAGKGQKSTENERGLTLSLCYLQNFIFPHGPGLRGAAKVRKPLSDSLRAAAAV